MSTDAESERDAEAVARFVERFTAVLVDAGIPRMPARVFVTLLATDSGRLTAAELAERLRVSPAAISGAVRYLTTVQLISREREPGSRRDQYVVHDDIWYEATLRREGILAAWEDRLREGLDALGADTPAGTRVAESLAFLEFLREEMPRMLDRWAERKAQLRAARG